jgi:hypothetical protein
MSISTERIQLIPLLALIVATVIIDSSFPGISPYVFEDEDFYNLTIFLVVFLLTAISQYAILRKISKKFVKILSFKRSNLFHTTNTIAPYILLFLLLIIVLEILITSRYHTFLVHIIIGIVYGIALMNMSVLVSQFFLWFRINKNYMIISYTVAICSILINLTASILYLTFNAHIDPSIISWDYIPGESSGTVTTIMDSIYQLTSVATFILIWISSILLLSHYAKKYGLIKFVIIAVAPLIYFITIFSPTLADYFLELSFYYPILTQITFTILISAGKPIGGFLFGFIFLSASKNVDNRLLKEYLAIAGYGIMILFTSNQLVSLISLDYPPFGTVTIIFLSLGSYISFIGIYASAISVAQDRELRYILKKSSERNISLFNQIGKSEMEKKLLTTADTMVKKLKDETGVQAVEDNDYKKYVEDAIKEINELKSKPKK